MGMFVFEGSVEFFHSDRNAFGQVMPLVPKVSGDPSTQIQAGTVLESVIGMYRHFSSS